MKYYILLSVLFLSNIFSQTFSGTVIDSNGQPISSVIVKSLENDTWTSTNVDGSFIIDLQNNQVIRFSRIGFKDKKINITDNDTGIVTLINQNISLNEVNIYGKSNLRYLKNKNLDNSFGNFLNNGALAQLPSLEIRTYGGYAGISSVSFESGFPRHTKVLFNGVDLTDAQNGQVDLSAFPSFALNSFNYRLNSGTKYGSGSIDGTIDINTKNRPNRIFYSVGDYGFNQFGATYTMGSERSKRSITIGKTEYEGDYKYSDPITNIKTRRENNFLDQFFLAMNREFIVKDDFLVNINTLKTKNIRGAAGSTNFPSLLAKRTDEYELYSLSFMKFFIDSSIKIYINRSTSNQIFDDPNESYPILSEHDLDQSSYGFDYEKIINSMFDFEVSAKQKSENISSTDLNYQDLDSSSLSFLMNYINSNKDYKISPSIRYDKQSDNSKGTYNISFESIDQFIRNNQSYFDFGFDIGTSFQFPTMNDLFWPDGLYSAGNPNLKPEKSDYFSANLTNNSSIGKFTITSSIKNYENLILWLPDSSLKYQPVNVSSASRKTYSINYLKESPISRFQLSYNIYNSKDSDLKKDLLYVPNSSLNIFFSKDFKENKGRILSYIPIAPISLKGNYKYTGKRILQYESDFNEQVNGKGYGILGLSISKELKDVETSLVIDNILDKKFESTLGYPEPGLSVKLVVQYKI